MAQTSGPYPRSPPPDPARRARERLSFEASPLLVLRTTPFDNPEEAE
jgi:hypothetical protein